MDDENNEDDKDNEEKDDKNDKDDEDEDNEDNGEEEFFCKNSLNGESDLPAKFGEAISIGTS